MKWAIFGMSLLLMVAFYTIIGQEIRYVQLQRYAIEVTTQYTKQDAALTKCIRNGYRNL